MTFSVSDQAVMIKDTAKRATPSCKEPYSKLFIPSCQQNDRQHHQIAEHHGQHIETAECYGRCTNPDFQVVVTIHHGILSIICQCPEYIAQ